MIKIYLDEGNPQSLKKDKNKEIDNKTFYLQGLLVRDEKSLKEILKKFHKFLQDHKNFFKSIYKPNPCWSKTINCWCKEKTHLYRTTDNNKISAILGKKEILTDKNKKWSLYLNFLDSIKKHCEMFYISFSEQERKKNLMFNINEKINYNFHGGKYNFVIQPLLENILISTGKIFDQYEHIEIILDTTNFYKTNETIKAECFFKYTASEFLNIKEWVKSEYLTKNKNKVWKCLESIMEWNLTKWKHDNYCVDNSCDFCNNPKKYKHYDFASFKRDMWYFNWKNNFNVNFYCSEKNNEFLIISDWIGKAILFLKKNQNLNFDFIKSINFQTLIKNNYAFTEHLLNSLKKIQTLKKNWKLNINCFVAI